MGATERRERERELRGNDILDAAEQLFYSQGFEKTTMLHIAQKAEYTKKTIYSYFKSKHEMYHAVINRASQRNLQKFQTAIDAGTTGHQKLKHYAITYYNCFQSNTELYRLSQYNCKQQYPPEKVGSEYRDKAQELFHTHQSLIRLALEIGVADGSFRKDLPIEKAVDYFLTILCTTCWHIFVAQVKRNEDFDEYLTFIMSSFVSKVT